MPLSGALAGKATKGRCWDEVQKRGHARTARSVTRYQGHGRLMGAKAILPSPQQAKSLGCVAHLADIILGHGSPVG